MRLILIAIALTLVNCTDPQIPTSGKQSSEPEESTTMGNAMGPKAGRGSTRDGGKSSSKPPESADGLTIDAGDDVGDSIEPSGVPSAVPDAGATAGTGGTLSTDAGTPTAVTPDAATPDVPGGDRDDSVIGIWQGRVEDSLRRPSTICMEVTQSAQAGLAGRMTYVGTYNCEANIEFDKVDGYAYWYTQDVLTMSRMCPAGRLRLERQRDGTLDFQSYFGPGSVPDETGTMLAVDSCPAS